MSFVVRSLTIRPTSFNRTPAPGAETLTSVPSSVTVWACRSDQGREGRALVRDLAVGAQFDVDSDVLQEPVLVDSDRGRVDVSALRDRRSAHAGEEVKSRHLLDKRAPGRMVRPPSPRWGR